ncbi:hypothetical protein M3P36_10915 [Altererythrobacter sp. KTW20L]|uniref:hypothetical protein n=1 Tax=Altererythrobacter sp. KTW20L TaxID=2942210 RepID=UPI0020BDA7DA|nr:hypothetical protein [Altererythrobacter sp. KTW20L]MCL6251546.1 hypothetical protein [Altererythrobacter sp. KTW20L]
MKWFDIEAWTEANFCNDFICRNRSIARSRRRNGRCEFSNRLFEVATDLLTLQIVQLTHRRGIGFQPVGDVDFNVTDGLTLNDRFDRSNQRCDPS